MTLRISKFFLLLLIFSLPFVRPFNASLFNFTVPSTDFIFLGAFGFWLAAIFQKQTRIRFDRFYVFLALYGFTLTLSTVFSRNPERSLYKLVGEFYLILLAVLIFNLVQSVEFLKRATQVWLLATFLTVSGSFVGFILFYLGYKTQTDNYFLYHFGTIPAGNYPRIESFFDNANMTCNYLNVSLMLALLADRLDWINKFSARILYAGIAFAGFFTLSPGIGGLCLSLGVWVWASLNFAGRKRLAFLALATGILLAFVFFTTALVSIDTPNTDQDFKVPFTERKFEPSVRILVWQSSLHTISEFPFLGKGTGADVASVQYTVISGERQFLRDAHNVWLNQFGQLGFVGFIIFVCLCVFLLRKCRFYLAENAEKSIIQLGLSCAFLGAFLYQGLEGSFEDARHLWVLFGLLASFGRDDVS